MENLFVPIRADLYQDGLPEYFNVTRIIALTRGVQNVENTISSYAANGSNYRPDGIFRRGFCSTFRRAVHAQIFAVIAKDRVRSEIAEWVR